MDAVKHHDPASLWAPRRQLTLAQARKRSQAVRLLRLGFSALAAIAIGLFLGYIIRSAIAKDATPVQVGQGEAVTMLNPRFSGRDHGRFRPPPPDDRHAGGPGQSGPHG